MQIVTEKLLNLGVDEDKEINESQLVLLDVKEDEKSGWRALSIDKQLSDARAELFVLLNGVEGKEIQDKIIFNYKALQKFRKEESDQEHVTIYCDGGCTPNPGKAGSGVAVYRNDKLSELWYGLYEERSEERRVGKEC